MAAAPEGSGPTAKPVDADPSSSSGSKEPQKPATALEEDDEFEDFPIDGAFFSPPFCFPHYLLLLYSVSPRLIIFLFFGVV